MADEPVSAAARGGALPEPVRQRVVRFAAACLGALAPDEVPAPLRRVAKFEPRRRPRLGGTQIAVALESDEGFRERVAEQMRVAEPSLSASVEQGEMPAAADPVDVAAAAYLLRPDGWEALITAASEAEEHDAATRLDTEVEKLRAQLDAAHAENRRETGALREQLDAARAEVRTLRARIHDERGRTRAAQDAAREANETAERAAGERARAVESAERAEAEARRLRARLTELEAQAESGRRSARTERAQETVRIAVLVDALVSAAQGVRRELALPTVGDRPADTVAASYGLEPGEPVPETTRDEGPEAVDRLLGVPHAHLVVDGYNVTKTGWPELTLEAQRSRLLSGLVRLAAQGLGEMTCVFDGSDVRGRVPPATARGVRVLFSRPGVTADDLIAELVAAEPPGRRIVVVSSDREVADRARRAGAHPLPSAALVHRLTTG